MRPQSLFEDTGKPIMIGTLVFIALVLGLSRYSLIVNPALETGFDTSAKRYVRHQEPAFLSFSELKLLARSPKTPWLLQAKLQKFWSTPVIDNGAYYRKARPVRPSSPEIGAYLRVASWNIEKSCHIAEAVRLFKSEKDFIGMLDPGAAPPGSPDREQVLGQRNRLAEADVLILQEMDIGVKRSNYVDAARDLAKALDMNYAFGAEQLEIDPVILGAEKILFDDGTEDTEATRHFAADPGKYKGVFGSAVLSRYPIKRARVFQLKTQPYDWYKQEKEKITFLEKSRRFGSRQVFENEITREVKKGGRIFFRVDLDVPDLPGRTLTVINVHLEIKCRPEDRTRQMLEILKYIRKIKNPVSLAGDFNSTSQDLSPTSVTRTAKRTVENPTTWFSAAVTYLSPHALAVNASRFFGSFTKNFQDPTAKDIPVIAPNKIKGLFDNIRAFRFSDGGVFDFRGDKARSVNGNDGTLANSNERDFKGFKTTFSVKRPLGPWIGKYRLDWIFVKSDFLKDPDDFQGAYRFAPHFAETLAEMNTSLKTQISDHHPSVVDLPFKEPGMKN